jgi:exosortase F-associated protein
MLLKMLNNKVKFFQILVLVCFFGLIRFFENELFYDPFLDFFKADGNAIYPIFDSFQIFISLVFRYLLNSIISLAILYVIFSDYTILKFTTILYCIFFVVLILIFYVLILFFDESHKMLLFYIRRFLIQPILLMLFIPGFYFQKLSSNKT